MPLLLFARSTLPPRRTLTPELHTHTRGSEDTNIDPANRKCSDRIRYSTNSDPRRTTHPSAPSAPPPLSTLRPRHAPAPPPPLGCFEAACAVAPMSFAVKSGPRLCFASWVSAGRLMARPSNANADSTPRSPSRRLPPVHPLHREMAPILCCTSRPPHTHTHTHTHTARAASL